MKAQLITKIRNILAELTPGQQAFFNRLYPEGLEGKTIAQLQTMANQCERSFESNAQNRTKLNELLVHYAHRSEQFKTVHPDYSETQPISSELLKIYTAFLEYVAPVVVTILPITHGLTPTPKDKQLNFHKFATEKEARNSFNHEYSDYFECGQGYSQEKAITHCYIADVFFEVTLIAEICGAKQDRGDKLYWVERIESQSYKHINEEEVINQRKQATIAKIEQLKRQIALLEAEIA